MSAIGADWRAAPLTRVEIVEAEGSKPATIAGPTGQNVSKDFERANCLSFFWRSRAVTSLAQQTPASASSQRSCGQRLIFFADDERELALVVHPLRLGRQHDVAAADDERRRRLEEEHRLVLGRDASELGGVVAVVLSDRDDLRRQRRRFGGPEGDRPRHSFQASSRSSPA